MAACPHCRQSISGQPGVLANCPFCNGRVKFYRVSVSKRSALPGRINLQLSKIRQSPAKVGRPDESSEKEWVKKLEFKPQTSSALAKPIQPTKQKSISRERESFSEIHEELGLIMFDLPLEEEQIKWEVKNGALKIKSLRLDFQYNEEVEIPAQWREREPDVSFLNGILSFSWKEKGEN